MTHITHNLMLNSHFVEAIYSGRKTFEIRRNDRGFQTGDHIVFTPFRSGEQDRAKMYPEHPIKDEEYEITYMLNGWGLKEDFVVLGIRRVEDDEREK